MQKDGNFEERVRRFNQKKLYIGIAMFTAMFLVYIFIKEFHIALFAFPAILFGLDPKDILKR